MRLFFYYFILSDKKIPLFLSFPAKKFVSLRLKPLGKIKNFKR